MTLAGGAETLASSASGMLQIAQAVTAACERLPELTAVINLGCAGAYAASGLQVGQAALATVSARINPRWMSE